MNTPEIFTTECSDGSTYRPQCPNCGRRHHNGGFIDGVGVYRCLGCGENFRRMHPDPEIDAQVQADIAEAIAYDRSVGLLPQL